jgi:hypothetical protein
MNWIHSPYRAHLYCGRGEINPLFHLVIGMRSLGGFNKLTGENISEIFTYRGGIIPLFHSVIGGEITVWFQ